MQGGAREAGENVRKREDAEGVGGVEGSKDQRPGGAGVGDAGVMEKVAAVGGVEGVNREGAAGSSSGEVAVDGRKTADEGQTTGTVIGASDKTGSSGDLSREPHGSVPPGGSTGVE